VCIAVGHVVVAGWRTDEVAIRAALSRSEGQHQLIYNKDALMVLPSTVNKALGVSLAAQLLGLTQDDLVGIGDAENDIDFLSVCRLSAAVANALPEVKARVHLVTRASHGEGVVELAGALLEYTLDWSVGDVQGASAKPEPAVV
jgi:hydroxymethylpyrimidine pyrophosphatase-like HAD family hydrolase